MYCPKCKSLLYPDDEKYMRYAGVCSSCVTYDNTPDKRYKAAYQRGLEAERKQAQANGKRRR
jgi:DNA-directed RNA polymerase subunit M/transcription elongation factor TFIIS